MQMKQMLSIFLVGLVLSVPFGKAQDIADDYGPATGDDDDSQDNSDNEEQYQPSAQEMSEGQNFVQQRDNAGPVQQQSPAQQDSDKSKDAPKTKESEDADKAKDSDKSKDTAKPGHTDKSKDSDKSENADKSKDTDHAKDTDNSKNADKSEGAPEGADEKDADKSKGAEKSKEKKAEATRQNKATEANNAQLLAIKQAPPAPAPTVFKVPATAEEAAEVARKAAHYSNKAARHSKRMIGHSKKALKHALHALHEARVDNLHLGKHQKKSLKKAEAHLRKATKKANFGKLDKLQRGLDGSKLKDEREQMLKGIQELRDQLKAKNIDDEEIDQAVGELEKDVKAAPPGTVSDESKAELERLRQLIDSMDAQPDPAVAKVATQAAPAIEAPEEEPPTPVQEKGLDIDTQMPYGELEPFGREDTAQELTESSVRESDGMVDQLERAEVAEEKRAVFRALTRLRGAAITSFDGVARSQTGNIDEYNKVHKWRSSHPLHHLADEESDVSKWAFPDNAD